MATYRSLAGDWYVICDFCEMDSEPMEDKEQAEYVNQDCNGMCINCQLWVEDHPEDAEVHGMYKNA